MRRLLERPALALAAAGLAAAVLTGAVFLAIAVSDRGAALDVLVGGAVIAAIETPHGRWEVLRPPPVPLARHFVVTLDDRRVLIGGGEDVRARRDYPIPTREGTRAWLYDLATGRSEEVARLDGVWIDARPALLEDGTVLIAGGYYLPPGEYDESAWPPGMGVGPLVWTELRRFDPRTRTFEALDPIPGEHAFVLSIAPSGRLTFANGRPGGSVIGYYDPFTGESDELAYYALSWQRSPAPPHWLYLDELTLLAFVGPETIEFVAPGTWNITRAERPPDFAHWPVDPAVVVLPDRRLLVTGGRLAPDEASWQLVRDGTGQPAWRKNEAVLVLDPTTGEVERAADLPAGYDFKRETVALPDGRALFRATRTTDGAETLLIYDPARDAFEEIEGAPKLPEAPAVETLPDGSLLFIGSRPPGMAPNGWEPAALRYFPAVR